MTTSPSAAQVYLDGRLCGFTPCEIPFSYFEKRLKGQKSLITIRVRKDGHYTWQKIVKTPDDIKSGHFHIRLNQKQANVTLKFNYRPDCIFFMSNFKATARTHTMKLPLGEYTLTAWKNGYPIEKRDVMVYENHKNEFAINFDKAHRPAVLNILSKPAGAKIYYGSALFGTSPMTLHGLSSGLYRFKGFKKGHESADQAVYLQKGQKDVLYFYLFPQKTHDGVTGDRFFSEKSSTRRESVKKDFLKSSHQWTPVEIFKTNRLSRLNGYESNGIRYCRVGGARDYYFYKNRFYKKSKGSFVPLWGGYGTSEYEFRNLSLGFLTKKYGAFYDKGSYAVCVYTFDDFEKKSSVRLLKKITYSDLDMKHRRLPFDVNTLSVFGDIVFFYDQAAGYFVLYNISTDKAQIKFWPYNFLKSHDSLFYLRMKNLFVTHRFLNVMGVFSLPDFEHLKFYKLQKILKDGQPIDDFFMISNDYYFKKQGEVYRYHISDKF